MGVLNLAVFSLLLLLRIVRAETDVADAQALRVIYNSLNQPPQLSGWKCSGGDPCGESWKGVSCSGSSVISIQVSGLGLSGTMGYQLSDLLSLAMLDLSNNNIQDTIPYQLPPNLTYCNLGSNELTGNLPYSISTMASLNYLNVSHNSLSQTIGDLFTNLADLSIMDLSFNNFTGDLPSSFNSLSNLSILNMQGNKLTGTVYALRGLALTNLNIANNNFTGWIPPEFTSISNLVTKGNSFKTSRAPPFPPLGRVHNNHSRGMTPHMPLLIDVNGTESNNETHSKSLAASLIAWIIMGSIFGVVLAIVALIFCLRKFPLGNRKMEIISIGRTSNIHGSNAKETANNSLEVCSLVSVVKKEIHEQIGQVDHQTLDLAAADQIVGERSLRRTGAGKRGKSPITAASYTIASLQTATNSFSQEFLVGEGSLGRVYKAEFPNGKVLAVKKIDSLALSLKEEDDFLEAVSYMSRLRHLSISPLLGYCSEHTQHLLVYEFHGNGTLHDRLHFIEDSSKILTWNARIKIALGSARALEYLHEVCLPPVVHRNFKSANILLDEELNPHVSDCGLADLTPNTERQVSAQMIDSFGYSAPEFAMTGSYTVKSDVYSFGVVMLELLTGRKPLDSSRKRSEHSLVRWAVPQLHDIDALAKMVDPALQGMYPAKSLSRFADVIAVCIQPEPKFRPPMSEVVQALIYLLQRASSSKRLSSDETILSYKPPEVNPSDSVA